MAHTLHTSERTLKRRLQDEGSSFQALLDQARRQDSLRLLAKPTLAIKQVAEAVGYTVRAVTLEARGLCPACRDA